MNKKLILPILLVAVGIGLGAYYFFAQRSQITELPAPFSPPPSATDAPVDIFAGQSSPHRLPPVTNAVTGVSVSFREVAGQPQTTEVYLGGQSIGTVGAQGISMHSFSPDNEYLAFITRSNFGVTTHGFTIYVIDLVDKEIIPIPQLSECCPRDLSQYIESYEWVNNDTLEIVLYLVKPRQEGTATSYYRVSDKETWRYNVVTRERNLVSATEE